MGLGKLLTRSTQYVATNTVTNEVQTFTIIDNIAPDWATHDYQGAWGIPGAWRASNLIADLLGSFPWKAYRSLAGRPIELLDPTPPLLEQPNPPDAAMTTYSSWGLDLLFHGNAIGLVAARNAQGWPTAAYAVPATAVGVRRVPAPGMSTLPVGALEYSVGTMRNLGTYDVIHIKGPCEPGAVRGMGVLEAHLNTLNLNRELGRQARAISQHGVPTGVITSSNPDTTDDELTAAKAAWLKAQRDRTVAALGFGTDFKPLSWNPEEMELIESRKFGLTELELIFGLPVGWLGGQTSSRTYSNIEQDAVNLIKFTLAGHLARFEQALSLQMPRGTVARANLDSLLRSDTLTRYQAHRIALGNDAPFLTVDEIREMENRAPMPPAAGPVQAGAGPLSGPATASTDNPTAQPAQAGPTA
jgi:HK97 family phage portal protein